MDEIGADAEREAQRRAAVEAGRAEFERLIAEERERQRAEGRRRIPLGVPLEPSDDDPPS